MSLPKIVEALGPDDITSFRTLLDVFAVSFEDADNYTKAQPTNEYLARFLARDHVIVLVARCAGDVIGGLVAYELEKFEQARSEIYVYDLAVLPQFRRQGAAMAIIDALKDQARKRSAQVIFVQADRGDDAAIALYTRLGQRNDVYHFDIQTT